MSTNKALYLNSQKVDLDEKFSFNLTFQCAEPGKMQLYGSGSSTIKLPLTPNNEKFFEYASQFQVETTKTFLTFVADYYEDNLPIVFGGRAYLLRTSKDGYELTMTWGNTDKINEWKNTPVERLSMGQFKWNHDSDVYYPPMQNTNAPYYQGFYLDGRTTKIRHNLVRPIVKWAKVLEAAGLNLSQDVNTLISRELNKAWLQISAVKSSLGGRVFKQFKEFGSRQSLLARGYNETYFKTGNWLQAKRINHPDFSGPLRLNLDADYTLLGYNIFSNPELFGWQATGYPATLQNCFVFFLSPVDYGDDTFHICRQNTERVTCAFNQNGDINTLRDYTPMYKCDVYTDGGVSQVGEAINALAVGFCRGYGQNPFFFHPIQDYSSYKIHLERDTDYFLYICAPFNPYAYSDSSGYGEWEIVKTECVLSGSNRQFNFEADAPQQEIEIISPDMPVLATNPPDIATMLQYKTAYEIIDDFVKFYNLMLTNVGGQLKFFNMQDVYNNLSRALDWSEDFISINKVDYGNNNLAKDNHVRYREWSGYTGSRDGSFEADVKNGKAEQEYAKFTQLVSFDTVEKIGNSYVAHSIPMFEIETDELGNNSVKKMNDGMGVPLYIIEASTPRSMTGADGNTYKVMSKNENNGENTDPRNQIMNLQFRINYLDDWKDFRKVVEQQRKVEISLLLKPWKLQDLDFRIPIYFKQLNAAVFVQKLDYKGSNTLSTLEGLVLN